MGNQELGIRDRWIRDLGIRTLGILSVMVNSYLLKLNSKQFTILHKFTLHNTIKFS